MGICQLWTWLDFVASTFTIEDEFWLVCAGQQKFNFYDENLWQICEKSKSQNWEDVTEDGAARSPGTEGDDDDNNGDDDDYDHDYDDYGDWWIGPSQIKFCHQ